MESTKNVWELLEDAPERLSATAQLYSWSLNYDYQTGTPFNAFLDLIGFGDDDISWNTPGYVIDYISVDAFAGALVEFGTRPEDVRDFIGELLEADH